jgi:hypothetical protein
MWRIPKSHREATVKRTLTLAALLMAVALPAVAGDWTLSFHMPSTDMGLSCGSTGAAHPAGHTRWVLRWSGPAAGADSTSNVADGALVSVGRTNQLDGAYTFSVWIMDQGGYSCPAVVLKTVTDTTPPSGPSDVTIVP